MKFVSLLLAYLISFSAIAAAPLGVGGQGTTTNLYPSVIQAPNKSVTKMAGGKALLETGNSNILSNPSFEGSDLSAWTYAPTPTTITTDVPHGKASFEFAPSSASFELSQDSSLNATAFADGSVQGLAYCRIKIPTTVTADIKFAPRRAGAIVSGLEVSVPKTGKWELVKVPFVLGATSNGVSVHSASYAAITASSIKVDDCFVGAVDLKQEVGLSRNQGYYSSPTSSSTLTNLASTFGNATDIFTVSSSLVTFNKKALVSLTLNSSYSTTDNPISISLSGSKSYGCIDRGRIATATTLYASCTLVAQVAPGDTANISITSGASGSFVVDATETVQSSTYSSTGFNNADRIGEVVFSSQSTAPDGFVSAMNKTLGKSTGDYQGSKYYTLYEHIWGLAGLSTTAGDVYRISSAKGASALADWDAGKAITIDYATNEVFIRAKGSARNLGSYQDSDNKAHAHDTIASSVDSAIAYASATKFNYAGNTWSANAGTSQRSVGIASSGTTESRPKNVALNAFIRYSGNSELMVAQLSGLESCSDSYECTDSYSAKVSSADAVSDENLEWITGDCTDADLGESTCTFKTGLFTTTPNCTATSFGAAYSIMDILSISTSSITVKALSRADAVTFVNVPFTLSCQKQGADYIGKTAKAVASDQNVRTPGVVNAISFTLDVNSSGVISNNASGIVTSCNGSTPKTCTLDTSKYTSLRCFSNRDGAAYSGGWMLGCSVETQPSGGSMVVGCVRSSATTAAEYVASHFSLFCHGQAP